MTKFDVIVIGAGVVGCAVARHFTLEGARVLTIEKASDLLDGASKGNSAILHTGFDAPSGTLEQQCVVDGYQSYMDIHESLGLSVHRIGALVIAWTDTDEDALNGILKKAHTNGIHDAHLVSAANIAKREPSLSKAAKAGISIPGESIIDPWTSPYLYQLQAIENGATLIRNCEVFGGEFNGTEWSLETNRGVFSGASVINCAGLYGDILDQRLIQKSAFKIHPRKGQFLIYDKSANPLLNSIILPVPNETTKGIVICPTVFGNVLVGPTAEPQSSRDDASVNTEVLQQLQEKGNQIVPDLQNHTITATYAGIRPATEHQDYSIENQSEKNYISVGGIRSTGLSAALGIAKYVFDLHTSVRKPYTSLKSPTWPTANSIDEKKERDWQKADNRGVVCHCEWVTRREIQQALEGPLPVASLAGLKRRTRATMGRCQGFYCTSKLVDMTEGYFNEPLSSSKA
ncbi:MAG: FAD-dependent oxidoreductase [Gammaproteobacteria bacterium]|nr:FAD-dependent oxidoreductase [Gammaproteobacteria bacterium]